MSNYVAYYKMLIDLCDAEGVYLRTYHLYDNLLHGDPPDPESYRTLVRFYNAELNRLKEYQEKTSKKALLCWQQLKRLVVAMGVYNADEAAVFLSQIQSREEDWDFRIKVRDWARIELDRAAAGKEVRFQDFAMLCGRYEELLLKRRKRAENK